MSLPILVLDFDGVLHEYTTPWTRADEIPDPPVPGAMAFLDEAVRYFRVAIFSSRSHQPGGVTAMKEWLTDHLAFFYSKRDGIAEAVKAITMVRDFIEFPLEKPPALVTLDDRALTFDGTWPSMETLKGFKPWNRK